MYAFNEVVGIRRNECKELRSRNFKKDENGDWCVEVEKGKGGKYQLQRIAPKYVEFVRGYFTRVKPDEYVFTLKEMKNNIELHALRAAVAKEHYSRVVCLAVTAESTSENKDGRPSSRSAAIDSLASGAEDGVKRLFLITSGNVQLSQYNEDKQIYPDACILHQVEDPVQAWNTLTVGAFTDRHVIGGEAHLPTHAAVHC